jgi:hypothetical protein
VLFGMSGVFLILLLLSIVGLLWGLIAPDHLSRTAKLKKSRARKEFGIVFGATAVICLILVSVTAPSPQQPAKTTALKITSSKKTTAQTQPKTTVTTQTVTQTSSVPFQTTTQQDSSLPKGQTKVVQAGQNGTEVTTYLVTYTNGKQTGKKQQSQTVTVPPLQQIAEDGTYVAAVSNSNTTGSSTTNGSSTVTPPSGCHPLSDEGTCYQPGEFCSSIDYGVSGVASNGESIECENNGGWRWEPV